MKLYVALTHSYYYCDVQRKKEASKKGKGRWMAEGDNVDSKMVPSFASFAFGVSLISLAIDR